MIYARTIYKNFYKILYTTYYYCSYICCMEKITETKRRRLERNERIKTKYEVMVAEGYMKSAVVADIAKSYRMTIPTVYSILKSQ